MESYHPEAVKKIPNRLLKCLECGEPVYAKYLCRAHYKEVGRRKRQRLKIREKEERKQARIEAAKRHLEENGSPCPVTTCNALTLSDSGLCGVHEGRANLWQFTPSELVSIYQEPRCAICGSEEWLVLDHKHGLDCEAGHKGSSGCPRCFRGLLCSGCNSTLGFARDDPNRLRRAADYLETHS